MLSSMSLLTSKRLAIGAVTFALFIIFDIVLFGWLIFNSLSQREVDKIFLETRAEAEPLAKKLEQQALSLGQDLYVAVSVVREETTYIQSFPTQREMIRRFEIRDHDGTVVYQEESAHELPLDETRVPRVETGEGGDSIEVPFTPDPELQEVEVAIGDLGTMIVGLNGQVLKERIGILRTDLIRQTSIIGVLTLTLLVAAFAAIWTLFRRSRRLEEQAIEAERLAYIGTLASGLAHEIRNPLNSLSLNMQMLEEEAQEQGHGGSQARLLSITRSELHRLERLATDFLSYAKPRPLERETVAAVDLLDRVLHLMGSEFRDRGVQVTVEDLGAGAMVRVDRGQINQLLINLTQNAIAAAEQADPGPGKVQLIARRQGASIALEVADNGPGIAAEHRDRMFDIFYSTRKGGTGLGLAIVQRIAKAHEAEIEVESELGSGTTLRLRLAVEARRAASAASGTETDLGLKPQTTG